MKILQLCNKPPFPPVDGGTMAMNSVTTGLMNYDHQVQVLSMESDKHRVNHHLMDDDYLRKTRFQSVYVDLNIHFGAAFAAWLTGESYHVKRFISKDYAQKLETVLKSDDFDVIHVESMFLTPYVPLIRKYSKAKVVLRAHNIEHLIWQRIAKCTKNPFKRSYLKHLSLTLKNYELSHINDFDGVVCITRHDMDCFVANGCVKPITAIPFGIDYPDNIDNVQEEEASLFHIGSMDWLPNQEGVVWFLDEVWNKVHDALPQVRLYLAGRKMPEKLLQAKIPNVSIVGEIPDAMYFIGSKKINIVPLLSGSGIRVKIIEAMSVGKTVISTAIGAEGINCTDGENILIANTPDEFVEQIKRCIDDPEFCRRIGNNAHKLISMEYGIDFVTKNLLDFYGKI